MLSQIGRKFPLLINPLVLGLYLQLYTYSRAVLAMKVEAKVKYLKIESFIID